MSTYMPKSGDIVRKWYVLDAAGKPLGRVAAEAAVLLRGKHKPQFAPHADCGDHVIIINAEKVVLTGNKLDQKMYYHHTGYIGNMKKVKCVQSRLLQLRRLLRVCFPTQQSAVKHSQDFVYMQVQSTSMPHRSPKSGHFNEGRQQ